MNRIGQQADRGCCLNCGAHVSTDFARTFGDDDNQVHRCQSCDSRGRIQRGSAAGLDIAVPDPQENPNRNRGARSDTHLTADGGRSQ
ncbi:DUF7563 family protein [Haloparvum sp. AD34]